MRKKILSLLSFLVIVGLFIYNIPSNPVDSKAVSAVSLQQMFDKMDSGNWYMNSNNDNAALGWHESIVMDSYVNMYLATKNTKYLDKLVTQAKGVLKQRDSVRGVSDYRGKSSPAWSSVRYNLNKQRYIWAVHTGMIVTPMARFATIVYNTPALANYKASADLLLQAAKDAVAVHDDEWVDMGTSGYYLIRKGAPVDYDGVGLPLNQMLSMGRAELAIYQAAGELKYLDRVTKIAKLFKSQLSVDTSKNAYTWHYDWGLKYNGWTTADKVSVNSPGFGGHKRYEDTSHGTLDIAAMYDFYNAGIVFAKDDLVKFGNTIEKNLLLSSTSAAAYVSGSGTYSTPSLMGQFLNLHNYSPSLYNFAYNGWNKTTSRGSDELLEASLLNLAHFEDINGSIPALGFTANAPSPAH